MLHAKSTDDSYGRRQIIAKARVLATLLPLAFAIGQGSAIQQPLALAIIAGLLIQFPMVLWAMPVLIGLTFGKPGRARAAR